jgi:secretion/DNA translocation related CpaE-like protein
LLITDDDVVADDVVRVAAAAGVELDHCRGPVSRALWQSAPLVILDAASVEPAVSARLHRRPGVIVVTPDSPSPRLFELCVRLGVDRTLPVNGAEEELISALSDAGGGEGGTGPCIAVIGACGGAGASVFAVALALAAARDGANSLLIDADPWGAGCDVLLGLEHHPGLRWKDLGTSSGRLPVEALQKALPAAQAGRGAVRVLASGRLATDDIDAHAMDLVVTAGRRSGGVTVIDVPRHPGDAADRAIDMADLAVLVAPADVRGCWAAERVTARIGAFGCRAGVVVRGPSPGGLGARELADVLRLPLLARMRADPSLPRDLDVGLSLVDRRRRPLAAAARRVLAEVVPAA